MDSDEMNLADRLKKKKVVMEKRKSDTDLATLCGPRALGRPVEP